MTNNEILDLAAEFDLITFGPQDLVMFAREVEAKTIERCARVCEVGIDVEHPIVKGHIMEKFEISPLLAAAIRALDVPEVSFGNMGENDER